MNNKQGQYLKEVFYTFISEKALTSINAMTFINEVCRKIGVKIISKRINLLDPGFDVLCGLSESCFYFGYWGEKRFVRIFLSSCKNFDENIVLRALKKYFPVLGKIEMEVHNNSSIDEYINEML